MYSPDLNLTPLAAFLRGFFAGRIAALGKNVKKQQEVSDLNQDYGYVQLVDTYRGTHDGDGVGLPQLQ